MENLPFLRNFYQNYALKLAVGGGFCEDNKFEPCSSFRRNFQMWFSQKVGIQSEENFVEIMQ
jgi:hypothetical protein